MAGRSYGRARPARCGLGGLPRCAKEQEAGAAATKGSAIQTRHALSQTRQASDGEAGPWASLWRRPRLRGRRCCADVSQLTLASGSWRRLFALAQPLLELCKPRSDIAEFKQHVVLGLLHLFYLL